MFPSVQPGEPWLISILAVAAKSLLCIAAITLQSCFTAHNLFNHITKLGFTFPIALNPFLRVRFILTHLVLPDNIYVFFPSNPDRICLALSLLLNIWSLYCLLLRVQFLSHPRSILRLSLQSLPLTADIFMPFSFSALLAFPVSAAGGCCQDGLISELS